MGSACGAARGGAAGCAWAADVGGRMLLMGHACTADEGCVCQCSLGVYMTVLQIMIVLIQLVTEGIRLEKCGWKCMNCFFVISIIPF